jgi:superfamily II DNA or RNA helicase
MAISLLLPALRRHASTGVVERGLAYERQGRVVECEVYRDGTLEGIVQGSRRYQVGLLIEAEQVWSVCSCPYDDRVCKHAIALAAHADRGWHSESLVRWWRTKGPVPPPEVVRRALAGEIEEDGQDEKTWQGRLEALARGARRRRDALRADDATTSAQFEVWIDAEQSRGRNGLLLDLVRARTLKGGGFGRRQPAKWDGLESYRTMPAQVLAALRPVRRLAVVQRRGWGSTAEGPLLLQGREAATALGMLDGVVPVRLVLGEDAVSTPLAWSDDPWAFELALERREEGGLAVRGRLRRGEDVRDLEQARLLLAHGLVLFDEDAAPLRDGGAFDWIVSMRKVGPLRAEAAETEAFVPRLLETAFGVPLDLGPLAQQAAPPTARLDLALGRSDKHVEAALVFRYGGACVPALSPRRQVVDQGPPLEVLLRDEAAERSLLDAFANEGGQRAAPEWTERPFRLPTEDLEARCGRLIEAGFEIFLARQQIRGGGSLSLKVRSGIDWFGLEGQASFDGRALKLPAILQAVAEGRGLVRLEDGSAALLPPAWVARLEALGALSASTSEEGQVRFAQARGPLLDILLSDLGEVETDAAFERLRTTLRTFTRLEPRPPPRAFHGTLRPYQCEAQGWLEFLRKAGLGGCLADDMGLGKTVQILAHLVRRRRAADRRGPSLVIAPRSVLTNWVREAEHFTPSMRTAIYHGPGRGEVLEDLERLDLLVTTYATMRADIGLLEGLPFDYVVLDESQAIKNRESRTARAACRLDAAHRLALSGTPIENHLDELGSLLQFLNPGLLGSRRQFQALTGGGTASPSPERLAWLQRALRPVILRRTREQVLDELPAKTEHVLRCPLPSAQRTAYDEIRDHYRAHVLAKVEERGLAKSKMHVLEALLRLRQAACHPALVDPQRHAQKAAKLEVLLPMLGEIAEAGHKALVFSQFTKFLSLVRQRLEAAGVSYEYMDGRTRKRAERIDRFQDEADVPVFLISLKAGGTGLNLTAAQYVFLLDPWWNPAVEDQAVGRAHRMGQGEHVTVYRLIGEDTVEDRVLELQARKQALVQAVLGGVADAPLRSITRDDLELLLG